MSMEWIKWLIVTLLFVAGVALNYFYGAVSWPIRFAGGLLFATLIVVLISKTTQGKAFLVFVRESRAELRKVFWPTRQETIQITISVAVIVVILGLFLWCMDSVLVWLLGWLTGQRG